MTRDVHWSGDDRDDDGEVFSALWAASPSFPQLPSDSPPEVKKLTIDIDDPKRVYTIYRASRRHNFQILVERYIIQLRYGCNSSHCVTPTCFTCRRRAAGNAPLRRYNATSARSLACHLASQDNPERGLCPYVTGHFPKPQTTSKVILKAPQARNEVDKRAESSKARPQHNGSISNTYRSSAGSERPTVSDEVQSSPHTERRQSFSNEVKPDPVRSTVQFGQPAAKIDHKSFVQNLFNTDAMKMLEWLTPNNLEALTSSYVEIRKLFSGGQRPKGNESITNNASATTEEDDASFSHGYSQFNSRSVSPDQDSLDGAQDGLQNLNDSMKRSGADLDKINHDVEVSSTTNHVAPDMDTTLSSSVSNSQRLETSKPVDLNVLNHKTEELNGHTHAPASLSDGKALQRRLSSEAKPKTSVKKQHRDAPLSFDVSVIERPVTRHDSPHSAPIAGPTIIEQPKSSNETGDNDKSTRPAIAIVEKKEQQIQSRSTAQKGSRPQSLSVLSIGLIDLLCEMLKAPYSQSFENLLSYNTPDLEVRKSSRQAFRQIPIPSRIQVTRQTDTEDQWRAFAEQSLFFVLSSPKDLLKSFRDENQTLLDTQSLWYCLKRLTEAAYPLVFDSLWLIANELYLTPQELGGTYEWARKTDVEVSCLEAAQLMSICLHALVAAVPDVSDNLDLANMSRIRSVGLSTLRIPQASPASIDLTLRHDDIFSDELALRLARRIFAVIPVRRQYQSLIRFTKDNLKGHHGSSQEDILDTVLAPLNSFDIDTPSVINFSARDRQLHEKMMPSLLIEWARTILLQDWNGKPEVPSDGSFGGALALMTAIYSKRKSLLLGDVLFRTEFFADRLDSTEMPVEWLSFDANNKTVHLLDYPYLFSPSVLVTYFRAINFSRMSRAFEAAGSMMGRVQAFMSPGTLITDTSRREDLHEKLRVATSKFLVLQIRRTNVLQDAFNQLWRREERELSRPLKIRLGEDSGEEGSDSGGVQQEFFRLAIAEALDPSYGAFNVDERTKMIWFQPGSPEPLWKFELIGLVVSLAVYNGLTLPITFPKALYRKLLGHPVSELHHIEDGWPDLASGLTTLLDWDEKDGLVSDVFSRTYEFSISLFGQEISQDMSDPANARWPQYREARRPNPTDARIVDGENRNEYVSDYIKWLTDISVRPQFMAFQRGFLSCLEGRSLSLFDPDLLQSVIEGVQEIDISELKRYARYVGWDSSHRSVKDFWSIVKRYGSEEKKKLLEFVTASDRVPVGGMRNLQFVVQRNGVGDIDGRLPTSYTCYGTLLLPEYSSKDILRQKLGMALENAKGFGFA